RHVSALPAASFRFPVTRDTFAVRLIVPLTGPIGIFHPLEMHHAGRTTKKLSEFKNSLSFFFATIGIDYSVKSHL
ncbi:MAG TPA: hypothetical protein VFQ86_02630, partial [Arachidicoccus soli]|nr:hypothetical protein [Arachidicoccus soli]